MKKLVLCTFLLALSFSAMKGQNTQLGSIFLKEQVISWDSFSGITPGSYPRGNSGIPEDTALPA